MLIGGGLLVARITVRVSLKAFQSYEKIYDDITETYNLSIRQN